MLALVLLAAGCGAPAPDTASVRNDQQGALINLALAAGYKIAGIPSYEVMRWTTYVWIPDCKAKITIDGNTAPAAENPTSFTVNSIGGVPLIVSNPGTDTTNLSAAALKSIDGMRQRLGCTR